MLNADTLDLIYEIEQWIQQGFFMAQNYAQRQSISVNNGEFFIHDLLKHKHILRTDFQRVCPIIVKSLVLKSMNIDIFNKYGDLAYYIATACGIIEADDILWFVKNLRGTRQDITDRFHAMCMAGQDLMIKKFVDDGVDVNKRLDATHELSHPLHLALRYYQHETVEELLKYGANPNVTALFDRTPLHKVCYDITDNYLLIESATKILNLLIKYKADVNAKDYFGNTPMFNAVMRAIYDFYNTNFYMTNFRLRPLGVLLQLKILVRAKADLTATNRVGQTVLHFLLDSDEEEINLYPFIEVMRWNEDRAAMVDLLLTNGAPIDALDHRHHSPLQVAMNHFNYHAVQVFLKHKADLKIVSFKRQTFERKRSAFGYCKAVIDLIKTIDILESGGYEMSQEELELVSDFLLLPRKCVVSDFNNLTTLLGFDFYNKIYSYVPGFHTSSTDDLSANIFQVNDELISAKFDEACGTTEIYQKFNKAATKLRSLRERPENYYTRAKDEQFYIETIELLKTEIEKESSLTYEEVNEARYKFDYIVERLNDFVKNILITGIVRKWVGSNMIEKYLKKKDKGSEELTEDLQKVSLN